MNDPDFGELIWDSDLSWWEGSILLSDSEPFQLYIHTLSDSEQGITSAARRAAARIITTEMEIRRYAAEELLEVHNENWNENDPISDDEFIHRLSPEAVLIHPDGYVEVGFADDDMFWGHQVTVRIKPDGSYQEAVIEG